MNSISFTFFTILSNASQILVVMTIEMAGPRQYTDKVCIFVHFMLEWSQNASVPYKIIEEPQTLKDNLGSRFSIHCHSLVNVVFVQMPHTIVFPHKPTRVSSFIPLNFLTHLTLFCSFTSMVSSTYRASFFLVLIVWRAECTEDAPHTALCTEHQHDSGYHQLLSQVCCS